MIHTRGYKRCYCGQHYHSPTEGLPWLKRGTSTVEMKHKHGHTKLQTCVGLDANERNVFACVVLLETHEARAPGSTLNSRACDMGRPRMFIFTVGYSILYTVS